MLYKKHENIDILQLNSLIEDIDEIVPSELKLSQKLDWASWACTPQTKQFLNLLSLRKIQLTSWVHNQAGNPDTYNVLLDKGGIREIVAIESFLQELFDGEKESKELNNV